VSARPVAIVGGGEHARVVAEAVRSRPDLFELVGFVDPQPCEETRRRLGLPRLGDDGWVRGRADVLLVLGVGAVGVGDVRRRVVERLGVDDGRWAAVCHARAVLSPTAQLRAGAVVMAGAVVQSGAVIGRQAVVNSGAVVEHDVTLGEFVQIGPAAALGGGCAVGDDAYVGLGARVRDHVRVGARALVGMGSVVVGAVPDGARVWGVPARPRG
jgi:acetyltransferase EpsM